MWRRNWTQCLLYTEGGSNIARNLLWITGPFVS